MSPGGGGGSPGKIGAACNRRPDDQPCIVLNSICRSGVCQCLPQYFANGPEECLLIDSGRWNIREVSIQLLKFQKALWAKIAIGRRIVVGMASSATTTPSNASVCRIMWRFRKSAFQVSSGRDAFFSNLKFLQPYSRESLAASIRDNARLRFRMRHARRRDNAGALRAPSPARPRVFHVSGIF